MQHERDSIFGNADKVREIFGQVDNVLVLENEAYEVFITDLSDTYTIEAAILLHLKDYGLGKTMDLVKVKTNAGATVIVMSDTLGYQTHVPYQALLAPIRVRIIYHNYFRLLFLEQVLKIS